MLGSTQCRETALITQSRYSTLLSFPWTAGCWQGTRQSPTPRGVEAVFSSLREASLPAWGQKSTRRAKGAPPATWVQEVLREVALLQGQGLCYRKPCAKEIPKTWHTGRGNYQNYLQGNPRHRDVGAGLLRSASFLRHSLQCCRSLTIASFCWQYSKAQLEGDI